MHWERRHYLHGDQRRGQHQGPGLPWYEMIDHILQNKVGNYSGAPDIQRSQELCLLNMIWVHISSFIAEHQIVKLTTTDVVL